MATSTIYDVILRYSLQDRATRGTERLGRATQQAARSAGMLDGAMSKIAAVGAGIFGAREAGKALIGFNSDLEQARVQMAGLMELNLGGEWAQNMGYANRLVSDFQTIAKQSVGTTKDFVDMSAMIVRPITAAGASMDDLRDMTKGATIAARAFNIESGEAARDIEQALMGNLTKRERFARAILEPAGFTTEKYNALSAKGRLDALSAALRGPAVQDMAKAQEKSWAGMTSTLEDNLQMALGKVGLPLMRQISSEVERWNHWIDDNSVKMGQMGRSLSEGLSSGFDVIKTVATFIYDNSSLLLTVAKAWAGLRIGSKIAGVLGGHMEQAGGWLQGLASKLLERNFDSVGVRAATLGASFLNAGAAVMRFTPAIGLAVGALHGLYSWWNQESAEAKHKREDLQASMKDLVKLGPKRAEMAKQLIEEGGASRAVAAGVRQSDIEQIAGRVLAQSNIGVAEAARQIGLRGGGGMEVRASLAEQGLAKQADEWKMARAELAKFSIENHLLNENQGKWSVQLNRLQDEIRDKIGLSSGEFDQFSMQLRMLELDLQRGVVDANDLLGLTKAQAEESFGARDSDADSMTKKPKVNITIQRIEVQSDDPDRFAFGLVEAFRDAAKNPSSAVDALREG